MKIRRTMLCLTVFFSLVAMIMSQGCVPKAVLVLGQPDFTSNAPNQGLGHAAANTLDRPAGPVAIDNNALYVADGDNNRVVKYSPVPVTNDPSASQIIESSDPAKWRNFSQPWGIAIDKGRLFVADQENSRVVMWKHIPKGDEPPDAVFGQRDLTAAPIQDCSHMNHPRAIFVGHGKMIVSEMDNNRVLIWNSIPERTDPTHPITADLMLGRPDCSADDAASTRHTFNNPRGVWTDGVRLMVADTENHRVLIWSKFPTHPTDDADIVLGTGQPGCTKEQLNGPYAVASNGSNLFVSDWYDHRVLIWDHFPTKSGDLPTAVIGQKNFERCDSNDTASASTLNAPQGLSYSKGQLWVTDTDNNRVLLFRVKEK